MSVELPGHLDLEGVLANYGARVSWERDDKRRELNLPPDLASQLAGFVDAAYDRFQVGGDRANTYLAIDALDADAPLTFAVGILPYADNLWDEQSFLVWFGFDRAVYSGTSLEERMRQSRASLPDGDTIISELGFIFDRGDGEFLIEHRRTLPDFRRQGLNSHLLRAAEHFAQRFFANHPPALDMTISLSQADVLCWAYNRGFRPVTPADEQLFLELVQGHELLSIGERGSFYRGLVKVEPLTLKKPIIMGLHSEIEGEQAVARQGVQTIHSADAKSPGSPT